MKYLKLSEIDRQNYTEFQNRDLTELIEVSKKVSVFYPCEVLVKISEYENKQYFEYGVIELKYKDLVFNIKYWDHKKRYDITCCSLHDFKNITNYTISHSLKSFKEPNNIGVLNLKKITEWFDYYVIVYQDLQKIDLDNSSKKDAFLKSIEGLPVEWFGNGQRGEIIKNGVKFSFTIDVTSVSKKLELYYQVPTSVESFIQLSQNNYIKQNN